MQKVQPGLGIKTCRDSSLVEVSDLLTTLVYLLIDQPVRDRNNPIQSLRVMCGEGVKPKGLGGRNNV